jgi:cytochrome c biogenesis protein CcmG, thiol:disulfide interchange protein DsbE
MVVVLRRLLPALALVVVVAAVVVGLMQASDGGDDSGGRAQANARFDLERELARLTGAPKPLAELHAQANRLLEGSPDDFRARLAELEGHPVVVNKWASWCGPCRAEFPIFQSQAVKRGKDVAFLGLNSGDNHGAAAEFLREFPVPYPSYEDPKEAIARAVKAPANYPITLFIDARGKTAYVHQGGYRSEADLAADIDRYL